MITEVRRGMPCVWTSEDKDIAEHLSAWARSEYKIADRRDAEQMFARVDEHEDQTHALATTRLVQLHEVRRGKDGGMARSVSSVETGADPAAV